MGRVLPILFNTDMVQAILDDKKNTTRRLVKGDIVLRSDMEHKVTFLPRKPRKERGIEIKSIKYFTLESFIEHEAPYQVGDILYVRETWHKYTKRIGEGERCRLQEFYGYKSSIANSEDANEKWCPSIHMPKEAARIWLKVTDVRAEQLQDMSHDGPAKEGIHFYECPSGFTWKSNTDMYNCYTTARGAMQALWNSTIKKSDVTLYGWDANPWVFAIEFEQCEKPESEESYEKN